MRMLRGGGLKRLRPGSLFTITIGEAEELTQS